MKDNLPKVQLPSIFDLQENNRFIFVIFLLVTVSILLEYIIIGGGAFVSVLVVDYFSAGCECHFIYEFAVICLFY